jgi:hypothetical protein
MQLILAILLRQEKIQLATKQEHYNNISTMAYKTNNTVTIADDRSGSFANVTIQNNGVLEVNSSDGFQGTVAGYVAGGTPVGGTRGSIEKFPFATDTNTTNVGFFSQFRSFNFGHSSATNGYTCGGFPVSSRIDKFPFAVDTNATYVADLLGDFYSAATQSSPLSGYSSGSTTGSESFGNTIQKFSFAVDSNATDVGDLTQQVVTSAGATSSTHGYTSGGLVTGPNTTNVIDKFPFASDTNAAVVGNLTQARAWVAGQSSTVSGYVSGGLIPSPNTPPIVNTIEKFPFSTDTNATDVGDLTVARERIAGSSSTISGYNCGGAQVGFPGAGAGLNVIDKFPFATDTNATDVGDLGITRYRMSGHQD